MDLQVFLESFTGQISVIVVIAVLFAVIAKKDKGGFNTKALATSAVLIAIAFALNQITLFRMPQGGSITPLSMLVVVLVGYFFGPRQGIMAGMAFGLLDLLIAPYAIMPIQILLDYPFAFGALGLAGLFRNRKKGLTIGYIVGVFGRFLCVFISGVVFWGSFAPEGSNVFVYSAVYNGTYLLVEGIITIVVLQIPAVKNMFDRLRKQVAEG
jgi:thiamine transporter